jgi:hypothetical protein
MMYELSVLALTSINPVDVFKNTNPEGVDENTPVAPPVIFADTSEPD